MADSASNSQTKSSKIVTNCSNSQLDSLPLENVMDLLDLGFFDCDEEILEQVNSLETDVRFSFVLFFLLVFFSVKGYDINLFSFS